ncbi:Trithorax group protein osa [Frankliniella fusca]|uniref:Trithorax group protein osa n=1 Tax=Frankliniella fusca TaxID=407009 RepID=A0AAE1I179_9NEOP|nr:Trithorax group protein osa [Frankliniella fusca]
MQWMNIKYETVKSCDFSSFFSLRREVASGGKDNVDERSLHDPSTSLSSGQGEKEEWWWGPLLDPRVRETKLLMRAEGVLGPLALLVVAAVVALDARQLGEESIVDKMRKDADLSESRYNT